MLGHIFSRIEREFGPAFWSVCEAVSPRPAPSISRIRIEHNLAHDSFEFRVYFDAGVDEIAYVFPHIDFRVSSRTASNHLEPGLRLLYDRVRRGHALWSRWNSVRTLLIENSEPSGDALVADLAAQESHRLEGLAVRDFPEASMKIQEAVREDRRYREVFHRAYSRMSSRYEPVEVWPVGFPADDAATSMAYWCRGFDRVVRPGPHECSDHVGLLNAFEPIENVLQEAFLYGTSGRTASFTPSGHYIFSPSVVRSTAEERAWGLLLEHLTADQRRMLDRHGHFHVIGGRTGQTYRIRRGTQVNIDVIGGRGSVVHQLCFQPRGASTTGDTMLAQKVMLELDEDEALRVAVKHQSIGQIWSEIVDLECGRVR